jgi:toxin FitB
MPERALPSVIAVLSSVHGEHHNPAPGRLCQGEVARPRRQSRPVHGAGSAGNPEGGSHAGRHPFGQSRRCHPATHPTSWRRRTCDSNTPAGSPPGEVWGVILIDTNVLSEVFKPAPFPVVLRWLAAQEPSSVFTTTITQAELLYGVESLPPGKRRTRLLVGIEKILNEEFEDRILPFDEEAARRFAKIVAARDAVGRPVSQFDAMIAAIAGSRHAALATRNTSDFEHCGIRIIDPWKE